MPYLKLTNIEILITLTLFKFLTIFNNYSICIIYLYAKFWRYYLNFQSEKMKKKWKYSLKKIFFYTKLIVNNKINNKLWLIN